MKNMQIAGTGNSRFMKSAISETATWEEFRAMLRAGTFAFDFNGINEAGITEKGTPYDVDSVLKDTTAALLGGDSSMVPDEALVALKNLIDGITPAGIGAGQVQAFSYAGTGQNGSANPTSITFGFAPKCVVFLMRKNTNGAFENMSLLLSKSSYGGSIVEITDLMTTSFTISRGVGFNGYNGTYYGKKSEDGKTISWYNTESAAFQFNGSNETYYGIALA